MPNVNQPRLEKRKQLHTVTPTAKSRRLRMGMGSILRNARTVKGITDKDPIAANKATYKAARIMFSIPKSAFLEPIKNRQIAVPTRLVSNHSRHARPQALGVDNG
ncbi:hypothetical protein GCM10027511_04310 [Hymenobacter humi]